ncbi:MAG TPA: helix-turn-helix domain-containing protein [Chthoniobacterales bacterium]|jgi:hypothetical protein|nr:helix-turn-helix domain-containing protein [Chthoniobacterales bacterium]
MASGLRLRTPWRGSLGLRAILNSSKRLVSEGKSVREIASVFNVHPATIYRLAYSAIGMAN